MKTEEELLAEGWKKGMLCIHVSEYDPHLYNGKEIPFRRLSYDLRNDFTSDQIDTIKMWANEINNRMPNLKVYLTGTGYYKPERIENDIKEG